MPTVRVGHTLDREGGGGAAAAALVVLRLHSVAAPGARTLIVAVTQDTVRDDGADEDKLKDGHALQGLGYAWSAERLQVHLV